MLWFTLMNEKCLADMKHQKADYQKRSTSFFVRIHDWFIIFYEHIFIKYVWFNFKNTLNF